jgi:hypothetical protein
MEDDIRDFVGGRCMICDVYVDKKENNYVIFEKTNEVALLCNECIRKQIIGWYVSLITPEMKRQAMEQRNKMREPLAELRGDTLYDEKQ